MSNPTSNFGWQMPTATDLVTDLPADFEVFGQAVDTALMDLKGGTTGQVLKKNTNADMDFVWAADSAGMTNPMTTTGDTIYSSSGSTPARLGIGSTGQVLTVSGGVPTWAAPSGAVENFVLLSSATPSGNTYTVSGLSGYNQIVVTMADVGYSGSINSTVLLRFNTDSGANYEWGGFVLNSATTYAPGNFTGTGSMTQNHFVLGAYSQSATSLAFGFAKLNGGNGSGKKVVQTVGGGAVAGSDFQSQRASGGIYNSTSVISSVSIIASQAGTSFNSGTVRVYGSVI